MLTNFSRHRMDSVVNGVTELLTQADCSTKDDQELLALGKMLTKTITNPVSVHKTPSWEAFADVAAAFDPLANQTAKNDSIKCR